MWSVGNAPQTAFVSTIGGERAEIMTNKLIGADDLDGFLEEIGAVYDELVWLGKQAGFYTMPTPFCRARYCRPLEKRRDRARWDHAACFRQVCNRCREVYPRHIRYRIPAEAPLLRSLVALRRCCSR